MYKREQVKLDDILLDIENPRFASYFERTGKDKKTATQKDIVEYLLEYESINVLAERIKEIKGLHPTELLACIKAEDKYIVLEGNRRVCACKELYTKYCNSNDEMELINNITTLEVVVYKGREQAQPYISDKHIDGVKKWESIEKSCYYYRMFQEKRMLCSNESVDKTVEAIAKVTISKKSEVRDCIIKYGFYMSVYNALIDAKCSRENLKDVTSFLPLVDHFMKIIVGNDADVGLGLPISDLNYIAHNGREQLLNTILKIIGEAFLVRKTGASFSDDSTYRINSKEVDTQKHQKKLIMDNIRIPGLFDLIKNYNAMSEIISDSDTAGEECNCQERSPDTPGKNEPDSIEPDSAENASAVENTREIDIYEPIIPWKPKQPQVKSLFFSKEDGQLFNFSDYNNEDIKIKFVISELSRLPVDKHPYSCTCLYRVLLEAVTKKAYIEKKPKENKHILTFDKKSLPIAASKLAKNNVLKMAEVDRATIIQYLDKHRLIDALNNYMHNPRIVDVDIIINSWITMREYIKACLQN